MIGGGGDDIYEIDSGNDRVYEDAGGGIDTVFAERAIKLAPNVENATLTGGGKGFIVGNAEDNVLIGAFGVNKIYAGDGDDTISGGDESDLIFSGNGNDSISGGNGDDTIVGGDGDDTIFGGAGRDIFNGGRGDDLFVYTDATDSGMGKPARDLIKAFDKFGDDVIDLAMIDADVTTGGDQAFTLIGEAAFSGTTGELRYGGNLLQGDVDGDGLADFEIVVNTNVLAADDFVL